MADATGSPTLPNGISAGQLTTTAIYSVQHCFLSGNRSAWRWARSPGEFLLNGPQVRLSGKRHRLFWFGKFQSVEFLVTDVCNVTRSGKRLAFSVRLPDGRLEPLAMDADSVACAEAIQSRLPTDLSQDAIEQQAFSKTLEQLGGKVYVTWVLLALNVGLFLCTVISGVSPVAPLGPELIPWGTNYAPQTANGEYWRLFTAMFLHFGVLHLALNMWALASLGPLLERLLGNHRFLLLYIFAGLGSSIASILWNPVVNSAGASGAVFGVIGGLLAFMANPRTRMPPSVAKAHRNSALIFIFYNLLNGLRHANIDNAAHLGGLVAGFGMGWLLARPLTAEAREREFPGLLLGAAIGTGALLLSAWPVPRRVAIAVDHLQFQAVFPQFIQKNEVMRQRFRNLIELRRERHIDDVELAARIESDILPQVDLARSVLEGFHPHDGTLQAKAREAILEYLESERLDRTLMIDALRNPGGEREDRLATIEKKESVLANRVREILQKNP